MILSNKTTMDKGQNDFQRSERLNVGAQVHAGTPIENYSSSADPFCERFSTKFMWWVLSSFSTRGGKIRANMAKNQQSSKKMFPELFRTELIQQTWCARQSKQFLWGSVSGFSTFSLVPELVEVQLCLQHWTSSKQKSTSPSNSCGEQNRSKPC